MIAWSFLAPVVAESNVVARVGQSTVTVDQVRQAVVRGGRNVFALESAREALGELVNTELLAQEARRSGVDQWPDVADRIRSILIEALVRERVDGALQDVEPEEAELRRYHEQQAGDFGRPGMVRAQVMTFLVRNAEVDMAVARTRQAMERLEGGETFEAVAARLAEDPSERVPSAQGTWFSTDTSQRRYPSDLTQVLMAARAGEVVGPVRTSRAVYVGRVLEVRPAVTLSYEEARPAVERAWRLDQRRRRYEDLCRGLRERQPVVVDERNLSEALENSVPTGGPPVGPGPRR
jgi:parvulin-like peptidyl-prolyl isomerase